MREIGNHGGSGAKPITDREVRDVWMKLRLDPDGKSALARLRKHGFDISGFKVGGRHLTLADYVALIPLVPNRTAARHIHSDARFKKYLPLLKQLRNFEKSLKDPFCEIRIMSDYETEVGQITADVSRAATTLEHFLSWNWSARRRNPRNTLIACLRSAIRNKTGKPHDNELGALIDAAYRAAGHSKGLYIDATALARIEKREKESRVKAVKELRSKGSKRFHFIP
jgi:hypothetical protein